MAEVFKFSSFEDLKACQKVCTLWKLEASRYIMPLHHVLEYLELPDIKSCRLVCKKWKKAASVTIVQKLVVNVDTYEKAEKFLRLRNNSHLSLQFKRLRFKTYIEMDSKVIQHFCNIFCEQATELELLNSRWSYSTLKNILLQESPNLTHLTIVSGFVGWLWSSKKLEISATMNNEQSTTIIPAMPKLKYLRLDLNVTNEYGKPSPNGRKLLLNLFCWAPNLETFWWDSTSNICQPTRRFIVDFILQTNSIQWPNLKLFRVGGKKDFLELNHIQMEQLKAKHFPLQDLRLKISSGGIQMDQLHSLIASYAATLKSLSLYYWSKGITCPAALEFPRSSTDMLARNIRKLELKAYMGSLHFLAEFPILECLILEDMNLSTLVDTAKNSDCFKNLKHVSCSRCFGFTLQNATLFPRVTSRIENSFKIP